MLPLPTHFVFGILQSGLTSGVASLVASMPQIAEGNMSHWLKSWLIAWALMLPLVILAAPSLQRIARLLTREKQAGR